MIKYICVEDGQNANTELITLSSLEQDDRCENESKQEGYLSLLFFPLLNQENANQFDDDDFFLFSTLP